MNQKAIKYETIFIEKYNDKLNSLFTDLENFLNIDDDIEYQQKLNTYTVEIKNQYEKYHKILNVNGEYYDDLFTVNLIKQIKDNHYKINKIGNFFNTDFPTFKKQFEGNKIIVKLSISFRLKVEELLVLIAEIEAVNFFHYITSRIYANEYETTADVIYGIKDIINPYFDKYVNIKLLNADRIIDAEEEVKDKKYTKDANNVISARQVLIMYYIFEELGLKKENRVLSAKARLIEILTGKNLDNIKKILKSPLDYKDFKNQREDLNFVLRVFEDLKLPAISNKIIKDIISIDKKQ